MVLVYKFTSLFLKEVDKYMSTKPRSRIMKA